MFRYKKTLDLNIKIEEQILLLQIRIKDFLKCFLAGTSQAENEQDPQAISALKRCISLDPANSAALMALAVSYTNESYQAQACHALTMWIQNNPEYANLRGGPRPPENLRFASSFMSKELHEETTKLYIKAARQKQGSMVDPDIQVGSHIFNTIGLLEFSIFLKSRLVLACFSTYLATMTRLLIASELLFQPDPQILFCGTGSASWYLKCVGSLYIFRLGATLANGNRSEEAIAAYHTALR